MAALLRQLQAAHARQFAAQLTLAMLPDVPPDKWPMIVEMLMDEVLRLPVKESAGRTQTH